jgi:hypothetical protein
MLASILAVAGCAHFVTAPAKGSEEALRQKVVMEWEAKVRKDWGVVYDLAVDAYKEKVDRNTLIRRANINVQEFSIKEVKIIEPGKKAVAVVDSKISQMGFNFHMPVKEEWLWENGAWHLNLLPTLRTPFDKKK